MREKDYGARTFSFSRSFSLSLSLSLSHSHTQTHALTRILALEKTSNMDVCRVSERAEHAPLT